MRARGGGGGGGGQIQDLERITACSSVKCTANLPRLCLHMFQNGGNCITCLY